MKTCQILKKKICNVVDYAPPSSPHECGFEATLKSSVGTRNPHFLFSDPVSPDKNTDVLFFKLQKNVLLKSHDGLNAFSVLDEMVYDDNN